MNPSPQDTGAAGVEPWPERKRKAEAACTRLQDAPGDREARAAVEGFAADPKWEVRKVIAEELASFPEDLFRKLEPVLRNDPNALVKTVARRSMQRKSPASGIARSTPGVVQGALSKIESRYGRSASSDALRLAEKFVELHLRSAVHDIKNVLTLFNLDVEEIAELLPSTHSRARLQRYENGRNYLEGLVAMMDRYSEDLSLKLVPESIPEILHESVQSAIEQLNSQGRSTSTVDCEIIAVDELVVPVSRFHFAMVVTNLAKNGIEAHAISPDAMRPGSVRIEARIEDDWLVIVVDDTGKGVAAGDLAKLREFIPGGSSKRRAGNKAGMGSGYGLPICRRYVEAHHGDIAIESEEDRGTRVTIRIPTAEYLEM